MMNCYSILGGRGYLWAKRLIRQHLSYQMIVTSIEDNLTPFFPLHVDIMFSCNMS